jgi:hypothetical protein
MPPPVQYGGSRWQGTPSSGSSTNWSVWIGLGIVAIAIVAIIGSVGNSQSGGLVPLDTFDYNQVYATAVPQETFVPVAFPAADPLVAVGKLNTARANHTATLLPDGRVLVIGGLNIVSGSNSALTSIEIYDPKTRSFTAAGDLKDARYDHTATLLRDGTVLIAGGRNGGGGWLYSAEIYDPKAGTTRYTGNLKSARAAASAVLLDSGLVLIVGGESFSGVVTSAEIYDPSTGVFSRTDTQFGGFVTATKTADGRVLIAGGGSDTWLAVSATTTYDPTGNLFTQTAMMQVPRTAATACLLPSGQVLIVGGYDDGKQVNATAEIYDPAGGDFKLMTLADARVHNTTTVLGDGSVLIVGGQDGYPGDPIATVERLDPVNGISNPIGTMSFARMGHTATLLNDGSILIVGGQSTNETILADAALYWPNGVPTAAPTPSPSPLPSVSTSGSPAGGAPSGSPAPSL